MKLYFKTEENQRLIGQPNSQLEAISMVIEDGKRRFITFKGPFLCERRPEDIMITILTNSTGSMSGGGKYLLEE